VNHWEENIDDVKYERDRLQRKVYDLERDVDYYAARHSRTGYASEEEWFGLCDDYDVVLDCAKQLLKALKAVVGKANRMFGKMMKAVLLDDTGIHDAIKKAEDELSALGCLDDENVVAGP
jgi:hypothetical protein